MGTYTISWQEELNGELHDLREIIEEANNHAQLVSKLHKFKKELGKLAKHRSDYSFFSKRNG